MKCFSSGLLNLREHTCQFILWAVLFLVLCTGSDGLSQEGDVLTLQEAVMCEAIKEVAPVNRTIVFSRAVKKAICFTSFSKVPENVIIYHNWYKRDKLTARVRLRLKPPQWTTFSSIPLKEKDKGPWRVEVIDPKGKLIRVLRFSVTD